MTVFIVGVFFHYRGCFFHYRECFFIIVGVFSLSSVLFLYSIYSKISVYIYSPLHIMCNNSIICYPRAGKMKI